MAAAEIIANNANEKVDLKRKRSSSTSQASPSTKASYTAADKQAEKAKAPGIDTDTQLIQASAAPKEQAPEKRQPKAGNSVTPPTHVLSVPQRQRLIQSDYKFFEALMEIELGRANAYEDVFHYTCDKARAVTFNDIRAQTFAREFIDKSQAMKFLRPMCSNTNVASRLVDLAVDRFRENILGDHLVNGDLHKVGSMSPEENLVCHMAWGPPERLSELLVMPWSVVAKDQSIQYKILDFALCALDGNGVAELRRKSGDDAKDFQLLTGRARDDSKVEGKEGKPGEATEGC
ncbi:hypothetical protein PRZ48_001482 [Zasmidium cellare]|uniref:Uncharacterized protein n=1 Tax=Zasmidium cellare TaxID=395010 RepID=A0ABR0F1C6_ZASCE|nr:hypothetical protein PRZ48_001482 [Zasmidium cellare]